MLHQLVDLKSTDLTMDENQKEENVKEENSKDEKQQLIDELTDLLKRTQADFQNYQKRIERDQEQYKVISKKLILLNVITIKDHFELALSQKKDDEFGKAMELIHSEFISMLQKEKVEEIDALNQEFDPKKHEVVVAISGEKNKVLEIIRKGYTINGEILRSAKVKVGKGEN